VHWRSPGPAVGIELVRPIPHGRDGTLATAHAGQASVPHQPGHTFATDTNAGGGKRRVRLPCLRSRVQLVQAAEFFQHLVAEFVDGVVIGQQLGVKDD
jgi:hypothetical protein